MIRFILQLQRISQPPKVSYAIFIHYSTHRCKVKLAQNVFNQSKLNDDPHNEHKKRSRERESNSEKETSIVFLRLCIS